MNPVKNFLVMMKKRLSTTFANHSAGREETCDVKGLSTTLANHTPGREATCDVKGYPQL